MRLFLAGIMQGSHLGSALHAQNYRERIKALIAEHLPQCDLYDPLADHTNSLEYDDQLGRSVFFKHAQMCRESQVVLAYLPQASMGTAIEMWEAHHAGKIVIAISPMKHNWAVRFLSNAIYTDLDEFAEAVENGEFARRLAEIRDKNFPGGSGK